MSQEDLQHQSHAKDQASRVANSQTSEERFRTFMSVSEDAIWYFELETPISIDEPVDLLIEAQWNSILAECNRSFAEDYGFADPQEIVGQRYRDLKGYERDEALIGSLFRSFIESGFRLDRTQTEERSLDGRERFFVKSALGVVKDGLLYGTWGTSFETTERVLHERKLQVERTRLRAFIEDADAAIGFFEYDQAIDLSLSAEEKGALSMQASLIDCNEAFAEIQGFSQREESFGSRPQGHHIEPYAPEFVAEVVASDFDLEDFAFTAKSSEGLPLHLLISVRGIREGNVIRGSWVQIKNVTDVRAEEIRFQRILENSYDGFVVYDQDGVILDAFGGVELFSGLKPEELVGLRGTDFGVEEELESLEQLWQGCLKAPGKPRYSRQQVRHRDGSIRWVQAVTTNRFDDPYVRGMVSNFRDVTEEHHREERMRDAQKLESLGVLAGGIAHDFNNLLLAILGNTNLARSRLLEPLAAERNLASIEAAAKRAAELCQQMLAYSGKAQSKIEPLSLTTHVREMASILEVSLTHRAEFELDLDPELPAIEGDRAQISQVVMNLITNAAEAIEHDQGKVTLRTSSLYCGPEMLRECVSDVELTEGDYVLLEVIDNGCGMNEETSRRLFEPFFTTKFSGRGLGMSAVLGIVRGHRGAIVLESVIDRGTTFSLLFPVSSRSIEGPRERVTETDSIDVEASRVLIVEDEEVIRELVREVLEMIPVRTVVAESGERALEIFAKDQDFDLILMDMTMPGMDGAETSRRILEIKRDVKVMISSGYSGASLQERIEGLRISGLIPKPYSVDSLTDAVLQALRG